MKTLVKPLAVVVVSLSLGGCAFTQANLNVFYDETKASKGPLSTISGLHTTVGEFKDIRPERDKIGYKRNGCGMKTADIVTKKPVPEIVREAFVAELAKNGHFTRPTNSDLIVSGEVSTFWFDYQINFWTVEFMGTVAVNFNVLNAKTRDALFVRNYQGHYNEKSMGGLDATWERVMNTALGRMVEQMSTDSRLLEVLRAFEKQERIEGSSDSARPD